jgi:hypothetical protein
MIASTGGAGDADSDGERGGAERHGQGGAEHAVADRREVDVEDGVPEVAESGGAGPRGGINSLAGGERERHGRGHEDGEDDRDR